MVCATSKASDQPAHTRSLIRAFASRLIKSMSVKLLTKHHLEFLLLKGGCTGLSESTLHLSKCHIVGNHMSRLNYVVGTQKNRLNETVLLSTQTYVKTNRLACLTQNTQLIRLAIRVNRTCIRTNRGLI